MTERFNNAVVKLYEAYHNDTLDAMDCCHCAVANLCDNRSSWLPLACRSLDYVGRPLRIPENYEFNNTSGYSKRELIKIESLFLYGIPNYYETKKPLFENTISNDDVAKGIASKKEQKELQFKGLCAVIEYLAQLDGIPNPFDFNSLFNENIEIAKKELRTYCYPEED